MASQTPPTYLEEDARPIYDDQELCEHLLRSLNAQASLEILPSKIHLDGTGLFAKEAIAEGAEVFRSTPLVSCVENGMYSVICDYCFTSSAGKINPVSGHFRAKGDIMPKINLCVQCRVCGYCSKVRL
jgi:ferredoxin